MTRTLDAGQDDIEASLISKIHGKGLLHLALDEVEVAYRSKSLPDKWHRQIGTRMPEQLRVEMAERLRRVNRLKDDAALGLEFGSAGAGLAFLRAVAAGELITTRRWLESKDRRQLMAAVDEQQRGCVHLAARAGHIEVLRLLLDHSAETEGCDRFWRTPLHLACEYGRRAAVKMLLDWGSQPGVEDKSGRTALHLAACCEDVEISRLLIARHPELVHRTDSRGRTPLFYSVLNIHIGHQEQITNLLLEHLAQVNARDSYGRIPLHYAAEDGRRGAVGLLLGRRADPHAEDTVDGRTPLGLASGEGVRVDLRRAMGSRPPAPAPTALATGPTPGKSPRLGRPSPHPAVASSSGPVQYGRHQESAVVPPGVSPPGALGTAFEAFQAQFVKIMERVQEGGMEQMEHVKRPLLFTGSWMLDVLTHQQLLGHTLKNVPGPEVCMRVFNLLRPPSHIPESKGDERDLISYYSGGTQAVPAVKPLGLGSDVNDPVDFANACEYASAQTGRVELVRALQERQRELEAKGAQVEDLQRRLEKQHTQLVDCIDQEEANVLRARAKKAQTQLGAQTEEIEELQVQARILGGQSKGLFEELKEEKEKTAELVSAESRLRRRLESEQAQRGEDRSAHQNFQLERQKAEVVQRQLEKQLREVEAERTCASQATQQLQQDLRRLQEEMLQKSAEAAAGIEAHKCRAGLAEHRLNSEASSSQELLSEVRAARAEASEEASKRSVAVREAHQLRAELQAAHREAASAKKLEAMVSRLQWEKEDLERNYRMMFSRYHLIGQMFLADGDEPSAADGEPWVENSALAGSLPATTAFVEPAQPSVSSSNIAAAQPGPPAATPAATTTPAASPAPSTQGSDTPRFGAATSAGSKSSEAPPLTQNDVQQQADDDLAALMKGFGGASTPSASSTAHPKESSSKGVDSPPPSAISANTEDPSVAMKDMFSKKKISASKSQRSGPSAAITEAKAVDPAPAAAPVLPATPPPAAPTAPIMKAQAKAEGPSAPVAPLLPDTPPPPVLPATPPPAAPTAPTVKAKAEVEGLAPPGAPVVSATPPPPVLPATPPPAAPTAPMVNAKAKAAGGLAAPPAPMLAATPPPPVLPVTPPPAAPTAAVKAKAKAETAGVPAAPVLPATPPAAAPLAPIVKTKATAQAPAAPTAPLLPATPPSAAQLAPIVKTKASATSANKSSTPPPPPVVGATAGKSSAPPPGMTSLAPLLPPAPPPPPQPPTVAK